MLLVPTLRTRLLTLTDFLVAALLATLIVGTTLAFGGATWWARPAVAALVAALTVLAMLRIPLQGAWQLNKSPMLPLGVLALLLAAVQLAPLPPAVSVAISPRSQALYSRGVLPELAWADDPDVLLPTPADVRSPATVDRPATVRWLLGASACLAVFAVVSHATDRLGRLRLVWGSIVAAFALNTAIGLVQLVGGAGGLYGAIEPGKGSAFAPTHDDLLATPNATTLRVAGEGDSGWALPRGDRPFLVGSLMGGPGAYLALGMLAMPLGLALTLQLLAPRGSREALGERLRQSGQGGLAFSLVASTVAGALMVGLLGGPWLAAPFALGLVLAGIPGGKAAGQRRVAVAITGLALLALIGGVLVGESGGRPRGVEPPANLAGWSAACGVWRETLEIARDFPLVGAGLGSFATIHSSYKATDAGTTTAGSSLLQWWAEAGVVGLSILGLGALWVLIRLPLVLRKVGSADRSLAFGLVGAVVGFAILSAVRWTVELAAVALAASAVLGTCDRWLAGGTDLFVDQP